MLLLTAQFLPRLSRNLTINLHLALWRSEMDWKIAIIILEEQLAIFFCTSCRNMMRFGSVTLEFKT